MCQIIRLLITVKRLATYLIANVEMFSKCAIPHNVMFGIRKVFVHLFQLSRKSHLALKMLSIFVPSG